MVVDDFDIGWAFLRPNKADAPLVVDTDRVLTATISCEGFGPIRGRRAQVAEVASGVKHVELTQRLLFNAAESFHERARPESLSRTVAKRPDHEGSV
jgi:hypothetical protein